MKLEPRHIDINQAITICVDKGLDVSVVQYGKKYSVKVSFDGQDKVFDKMIYKDRVNSAIKKTWRYFAAKIINNEKIELCQISQNQ